MGSLTSQQRIAVFLELLGGPNYARQMKSASAATATLGRATNVTGKEMQVAGRRTFLMNQALYTLRRYAFYATTALGFAGVALVKLGYNYLAAMQTAKVALGPVIKNHAVLNNYLKELFRISKYSPFVITDLAKGFQQLVIGTRGAGIALPTILKTIKSITDLQSVTGKVGPGSLNKVTTALTHMAFAGRLTGRLVNQLYQNGIPIFDILSTKLGITGDQLKNISNLGIPAGRVLKAINDYVSGNKAFSGAAFRLSVKTLPGMLQVLRDSISQLSGAFIGSSYTGFQNWLYGIVRPGGPLDKISNIGNSKGGGAAVIGISRSLTGNSGLGRGFLLLVDIVKQFGRVITNVMVPALLIAMHSLIVFWPILKAVDLTFKFLADHGKIFKWVLSILAAEFVIAHANIILLGLGMRIFGFLTFGSVKPLIMMIKAVRLLRTVELAGLITRMTKYAFATKTATDAYGRFSGTTYKNNGILAGFIRTVTRAINALKRLRAAMVEAGFLTTATIAAPTIIGSALAGEAYFGHVQSKHISQIGNGTVTSKGVKYALGGRVAGMQDQTIHTHVYIDGKEVANAVDKAKSDKRARK